jgi:hypothetical protein
MENMIIRFKVNLHLAILSLFAAAVVSGDDAAKKQAQLIRSGNVQFLGPDGFPVGTQQLSKGVIFDVVEETFSDVFGVLDGRKFRVSRQLVTLTEREGELQSTVAGFTPGQLVIISARYSLEGNQPRNVKSKLLKYLPKDGLLTEPVAFLVSDDLSRSAENQKTLFQSSQTSVTVTDPDTLEQVVVTQTQTSGVPSSPNTLVVEYTFNGKKGRKVGIEGREMILP